MNAWWISSSVAPGGEHAPDGERPAPAKAPPGPARRWRNRAGSPRRRRGTRARACRSSGSTRRPEPRAGTARRSGRGGRLPQTIAASAGPPDRHQPKEKGAAQARRPRSWNGPRLARPRAWTDPSARALLRRRLGGGLTRSALGAAALRDGFWPSASSPPSPSVFFLRTVSTRPPDGPPRPVGEGLLLRALLLRLELEVDELEDGRLGGVALARRRAGGCACSRPAGPRSAERSSRRAS